MMPQRTSTRTCGPQAGPARAAGRRPTRANPVIVDDFLHMRGESSTIMENAAQGWRRWWRMAGLARCGDAGYPAGGCAGGSPEPRATRHYPWKPTYRTERDAHRAD